MENKAKRVNRRQKNILYAAMAVNRKILECRSGCDSDPRQGRKAVWKRVVEELNMAGPKKDITQWRKVWTDLRLGMRKKWNKAQKSNYILNEYDRRVINACGMIGKSGDENCDEKSADEINSFLAFLQEPIQDYSNDEKNTYSIYLEDSSEFILSQPTDLNVEEEFGEEQNNCEEYEEHDEPYVEYISDEESTIRTKLEAEFREPSVEFISDDDDRKTIKLESPPHSSYEEQILPEPLPIKLESPEMSPVQSLPQPLPLPLPLPTKNKNIPWRKNLRNATLKEIRKMHRNLLRESKKQTALLRKLVKGIEH